MSPAGRFFQHALYWIIAAGIITFLYYRADPHILYHADSLYPAYVFFELFQENQPPYKIRFTPSPYLFPDLVIYGFFYNILKDLFFSQYLYGIIQTLAAAAITSLFLMRIQNPDFHNEEQKSLRFYMYFASFLFFPSLSSGFAPLLSVFLPAMHFSVLPVSILILLIVTDHNYQTGITGKAAVTVITALMTASDPLFIISSVLIMTGISAYSLKNERFRNILYPAAGTIAGILLYHVAEYFLLISDAPAFSSENSWKSFSVFSRDLADTVFTDPAGAALILTAAVSVILSLYILFTDKLSLSYSGRVFLFWYVLFVPVSVAAPVVSGIYSDTYSFRYMMPGLFLSFPVSSAAIHMILCKFRNCIKYNQSNPLAAKSLKKNGSYEYILFFLLFTAAASAAVWSFYKVSSFSYYPPDYACAYDNLKDQNLRRGEGGFWAAMRITLLSAHYEKESERRIRIYMEKDERISSLPPPSEKKECSPWGFRIWIYRQY